MNGETEPNIGEKLAQQPMRACTCGTRSTVKIVIVFYLKPVWHGIGEEEKCLSLEQPRGNFYKTGCQNNSIELNFNLQKSLEIFEKISADKI